MEFRVHGGNEHRVFYVARYEEAVYVLHCFVKKTQATRKADLDLGRKRYAALIEARTSSASGSVLMRYTGCVPGAKARTNDSTASC